MLTADTSPATPPPKVTVGIVTYNSAPALEGCARGIKQQDYPELELIVVDNASTDNSLEVADQLLPAARVILNEVNVGFAAAHNQAIRASEGKYYLALNPDVEMMGEFVSLLVQALEARPEYGAAIGKMWQAYDTIPKIIDGCGLYLDRARHQYLRGHGQRDLGQYDDAQEVFGGDGAAILLRRETLEDIEIEGEYFDELFFLHKEDVDLAWRARLMGWHTWYEPRAVSIHGRTFKPGLPRMVPGDIRRLSVRNRYFMIVKNLSLRGFWSDLPAILWYDLRAFLYMLFLEQWSLGAYFMFLRRLPRLLRHRHEIQARRVVSDEEMLEWSRISPQGKTSGLLR
ncbi:MAG: glycosyltransferase family 2 protein [Anaerolineales bacterium]